MLRITGIKIRIPHDSKALTEEIRRRAKGQKPLDYRIVRRSVDARKKPDLYYVYTIDASFKEEKKLLRGRGSRWQVIEDKEYRFPYRNDFPGTKRPRPVIVGFGPAGIFAGLMLARAGYAPLILERGDEVDRRSRQVEDFFEGNELDPESNVQFGEGGAGTFSDGKLNTAVKDPFGRNRFVLREFVSHGAPEDILYDAKPHVGTDILRRIVRSMREEILSLGGEIRFRTKMTRLVCKDNKITGLVCQKDVREEIIPADVVILAPGHSARDTFSTLYSQGLLMTPKAFAIGIRVEHPARMINESMYGDGYPEELPAANYRLTHQCDDGRGVYSFCMCPGGYVVNSSSEKGCLCVNGMSESGRDAANSNSAIIVSVTPEDFPSDHPLAGIEFQRTWERKAYELCRGQIPVQLYRDFRENRTSVSLGEFSPMIKGQWAFGNLRECLPDMVSADIIEGMETFGKKISGYDRDDTLFSGVETRTSSPLRIERDKDYQSNITGLFPCGEGAGYAGGITSAAMDGIRVAEAAASYMNQWKGRGSDE